MQVSFTQGEPFAGMDAKSVLSTGAPRTGSGVHRRRLGAQWEAVLEQKESQGEPASLQDFPPVKPVRQETGQTGQQGGQSPIAKPLWEEEMSRETCFPEPHCHAESLLTTKCLLSGSEWVHLEQRIKHREKHRTTGFWRWQRMKKDVTLSSNKMREAGIISNFLLQKNP